MPLTPGQVLLSDIFPSDVYQPGMTIDKKAAGKLYTELADRYPEQYRDILFNSTILGRDVAVMTGGGSFSIDNLKKPAGAKKRREAAVKRISTILDTYPPEKQRAALVDTLIKLRKEDVDLTVQEAEKEGNPLVRILKGAGRGNPASIARLISSDVMYADNEGNPIPVPVLRSYSEGLTPAEFIASSFGARKGVTESKLSVVSSGYMAKLLSATAHRAVVTGEDAPDSLLDIVRERGLPVETADRDNVGALLAADAGPYKANTTLTPKILADLSRRKINEILVRSPLTSVDPDGGVYARDVGLRESQRLAEVGSSPGITAAAALAEPLIQMTLNSKHSGGVATGAKKELSSFDKLEKLFNTPQEFREGATHSQVDGKVDSVEDAPQGGTYVTVGQEQHYVPDTQQVTVKPGQTLEAGDMLSDGIPNPRELIKHKGIGEGARQLTFAIRDGVNSSGAYANRRNVELVVRGLANRVKMTDEYGDHVVGDVVPYTSIAANWQPRDGHKVSDLSKARNRYLERPVLHYSIGTRITPSVIAMLKKHKIKNVITHADPPPFEPEAVRAVDLLRTDEDWMTRQIGTGLQRSLLDATHRALDSDREGVSFVPGRAYAVDFNRVGKLKLPSPPPVTPGTRHTPRTVPNFTSRSGATTNVSDDDPISRLDFPESV